MPLSNARRYLRNRINNPMVSSLAERAGSAAGKYLHARRKRYDTSIAKRRGYPKKPDVHRPTAGKESGLTERQPYVRKRGKRVKIRGAKRVKVSKSLREKVNKVIAGNEIYGYMQTNQIEAEIVLNPNQQTTTSFPNNGNQWAGYLFNARRILHCASRLWNKKVAQAQPDIGQADMLPFKSAEIKVHKQWWTFRLKNNYERTVKIRLFKCQARGPQSTVNARDAYNEGLLAMFSAETGRNQADTTITSNQMYVTPFLSPTFNQFYKADLYEITLEPGQKHEFTITGPAREYDFNKMINGITGAELIPVQKDDLQLIWQMNLDIVQTTAGVGRGVTGDSSEKVFIESTYHVKMTMPENILQVVESGVPGTRIPTALGRKRSFIYDNFELIGAQPNNIIDRVDELTGEKTI